MQLFKSRISDGQNNGFFARVLASILVFCLVLVTLIFILIYQNVKSQSLRSSFLAEQEVITNVSYSAEIMQDTAKSMLAQLNGSSSTQQLIYSHNTRRLSILQSMRSLQNQTRASQWIDSIYIYCSNDDSICYSYKGGNGYPLTFSSSDEFFDRAYIQSLSELDSIPQLPQMRSVRYTEHLPEKTVFTYALPVRSASDTYDGFFIVNISAERLMYLSSSIANSDTRQLMIVDRTGQTYSDGQSHLNEQQQEQVLQQILSEEASTGQIVISDADAICTWTKSEQTGLFFLSCVSYSDIQRQLSSLTSWFVLFYVAVLVFSALICVYLAARINRDYAVLERQYALSEKRYAENYSYIKQSILRSFFMLKNTEFVIGRQFADNDILLEQYSGFTLLLLHLRQTRITDEQQNVRYRRAHFLLQEQLTRILPEDVRYELVDMFQGRFLLVLEPSAALPTDTLCKKLRAGFADSADYSLSGVYTDELSAIEQLPECYRTLTGALEQLFFYPADSLISFAELSSRQCVGNEQAEQVRSRVIQALVSQRFEDASSSLGEFYDAWFEPAGDVPLTIDAILAGFSEYISTFKRAYAVTMDFNAARFRAEALRADSSRAVRQLFLDLIQDISCAFASIDTRSNYIDDLIGFIAQNYADSKLNIDVLADHVGLSASHIQNIFKTATGSSISSYLRSLRLQKATELLEQTDIPISEIAASTGFGNSNYFYTVFKRHYAITPTEYRANARAKQDKKENES